jgi:Mn2+/Fe2+ NRAMP family transporter
MGDLANTKPTTAVAVTIAALIVSLNVFLLYEILLG